MAARELGPCWAALVGAVLLLAPGIAFGPTGAAIHPSTPTRPPSADPPAPEAGAAAIAAAEGSLPSSLRPSLALAGACGPSSASRLPPGSCPLRLPPLRPGSGSGDAWTQLGNWTSHFGYGLVYDAADRYVLDLGTGGNTTTSWTFANGIWTNLTGHVTGAPDPRFGAALAYDPAISAVVLVGGAAIANGTLVFRNDTWEYAHGTWTNATASVGAPSELTDASLAWDANDSALVLFGGVQPAGFYEGAGVNFTYELKGGNWTNVSANQTIAPGPVPSPSMAADGTDGDVVLFDTASSPYGGNATWTFTGNQWHNVTSPTTPAPLGRLATTVATDTAGGGVVLFGGARDIGLVGDTWRFASGRWTELSPGSPGTPGFRLDGLLSDDPVDGGVLLVGGSDGGEVSELGDSWLLNGSSWHLETAGASPPPLEQPAMAYDSTSRSVILFGGSTDNETWSFSAGTWTLLHPSESPSSRVEAAIADDPSDQGLVLFGGSPLTGFEADGDSVLGDTWIWANADWTNVTATAGGPPARALAAAAWDPGTDSVVLFGGTTNLSGYSDLFEQGGFLADTWTFAAGHWTPVAPRASIPSARAGAAMAADPVDDDTVLFGGACATAAGPTIDCNDTWTFADGNWTDRAGGPAPSPREEPGFAFDPWIPADVLFGGVDSECLSTNDSTDCFEATQSTDTWSFVDGNWTNLSTGLPTNPGSGYGGGAFVEDPADGYLLLLESGVGTYSVGTGSWWAFSAPSSAPLTVARPTATLDPVDVGATVNVSVVIAGGHLPYTLAWSGLPTGCASANADSVLCTPTATGSFDVAVDATDLYGLNATGPSLLLTVDPAAVLVGASIQSSATSVEIGGTVGLRASATGPGEVPVGGVSFAWTVQPAEAAAFNASTGANVTLRAGNAPGVVVVGVSATDELGVVAAFANLTVYELTGFRFAISQFSVAPSTISLGSTVNFTTRVSGGSLPYSFAFTGLPEGCLGSSGANFFCRPTATGSFYVIVHVTDFNGTTVQAHASLSVSNGSEVVPSRSPPFPTVDLVVGATVVVAGAIVLALVGRGRRGPPAGGGAPSASAPTDAPAEPPSAPGPTPPP